MKDNERRVWDSLTDFVKSNGVWVDRPDVLQRYLEFDTQIKIVSKGEGCMTRDNQITINLEVVEALSIDFDFSFDEIFEYLVEHETQHLKAGTGNFVKRVKISKSGDIRIAKKIMNDAIRTEKKVMEAARRFACSEVMDANNLVTLRKIFTNVIESIKAGFLPQVFVIRTFQVFGRGNIGKVPKARAYLAFDIEDDSNGHFLIGAIYGYKYTKHTGDKKEDKKLEFFAKVYLGEKGFYEMCDFINNLTPKEAYLIGFNTDYDLGILDSELKIKRLYAKSRFIQAKNENGCVIHDLGNHFDRGSTLGDLMKELSEHDKMEKDIPTDAEDAERRAGVINEAWITRCKHDAEATWKLTNERQQFYLENDTSFKATVGSSTLELFRRRFFTHFWKRPEKLFWLNKYEREAYRGGRTEVFDKNKLNIESYDINSAYVSIMERNVFPDPNSAVWVKRPDVNKFMELSAKFQGISEVSIEIPEMMYPPLPYQTEEGKLIFPVGKIRAWFTFAEIKLALDVGGKIKTVHRCIYYKRSFPYFKEFAEWVWSERQKHPKDTEPLLNRQLKLCGNGLYGKFGQQNVFGEEYVPKIDYGAWIAKNRKKIKVLEKALSGECKERETKIEKLKALRNLKAIELATCYLIKEEGKETKVEARHAFPILSLYITSLVRIKLYKEIVLHKSCYTDTDCVKFVGDKNEMEDTKELGGWGYEGAHEFQAFAPKFYCQDRIYKVKGTASRVLNPKEEDGMKIEVKQTKEGEITEITSKSGTVVITPTEIKATTQKPYRWRESERSKGKHLPSVWRDITKVSRKTDNKRIWRVDLTSKPIRIKEYRHSNGGEK